MHSICKDAILFLLLWHQTEIVAQPVRASDCGSEGRGFEPRLSPLLFLVRNSTKSLFKRALLSFGPARICKIGIIHPWSVSPQTILGIKHKTVSPQTILGSSIKRPLANCFLKIPGSYADTGKKATRRAQR